MIARELYAGVKALPIVGPHGHTDPAWFAIHVNVGNPGDLLMIADHNVFRMPSRAATSRNSQTSISSARMKPYFASESPWRTKAAAS